MADDLEKERREREFERQFHAAERERYRIWLLILGTILGLFVLVMIFNEPARTDLCPRDYFDKYGRCP